MSRILIITNPTTRGHINPVVRVVEALNEGGHHVGWLATTPEQATLVSAIGVDVIENEQSYDLKAGDVVDWFKTDDSRVQAFRSICIDVVPRLLDSVRGALRAFCPDVVVVDSCTWLGVVAAELEGIPWVSMCMGLKLLDPGTLDYNYARLVKRLDPVRDALFASYGIQREFRLMECVSPHANIVFATSALVGADAQTPADTFLVGPSIPRGARGDEPRDFSFDGLDGRRLVYVALGSALWRVHRGLLEEIASVAASFDVNVLVAIGDLPPDARPTQWPANVRAVSYAPQLEVLTRAALFITHGGANSVMEAMYSGVPLLVVPVWADQPLQAHFVTQAGAGEALDPETFTRDRCAEAIARLLAPDNEYAAAARAIALSYRERDGGRAAADKIIEVAQRARRTTANAVVSS